MSPLLSAGPRRDPGVPSIGLWIQKTAGQRGGCLRFWVARL